jgi:uncharacterized membrane-anchored protein YitT (DUF2179 family)
MSILPKSKRFLENMNMQTTKRIALLVFASVLIAFNLNTFVKAAGLIPGGFTGLVILIQEIIQRLTGFEVPFSITYYLLNAAPVYVCFRYIGKKFTLLSCLTVFLTGILADMVPGIFLEYLHDKLLSAVFGGLLNGGAISLCLVAGATSGGTDFIAIYFSEKQGRDTWHYIFAGNCVMLMIFGLLWTPEAALYSIIFQWVATTTTTALYKGYQQKTLLIITAKHEEVYALIREKTHHAATAFTGVGEYQKAERVMLYSVVCANDVHGLVAAIKKIDSGAFVNVLKTEQINGRFYRPPKD